MTNYTHQAKKEIEQAERELVLAESQPKSTTFGGELGRSRAIRAAKRKIHLARSRYPGITLTGYLRT